MKIKIMGVGGAGKNMLISLIDMGFDPKNAVCVDTDITSFQMYNWKNFIHLGKDILGGRGTGANPDRGRMVAELGKVEIVEAVKGADIVMLVGGLGGGLGSGALAYIGALISAFAKVKAIVTLPVKIEGEKRKSRAMASVTELIYTIGEENVCIVETAKASLGRIFSVMDYVVAKKVIELINSISPKFENG